MILKDYILSFSGLKEGKYDFDYQAEDLFFQHFEHPDINGGSIQIHVDMLKKNTFLELNFNISGTLKLVCDRCLEVFDCNIDTSEKLYVRFGDHHEELNDNVIIIPVNETRLDISQYIYEFAALSLPIKRVHPVDQNGNYTCNPEMLNLLKKHTPENMEINPVWENIKNILN